MSSDPSRPKLAFLEGERAADYGGLLARWRWRQACGRGEEAVDVAPDAPARQVFAGSEAWLVVLDSAAVPLSGAPAPAPSPGRVIVSSTLPSPPPQAHTLRELQDSRVAATRDAAGNGGEAAAILFRPGDFPAQPDETSAAYIRRLAGDTSVRAFHPALAALALDASGEPRSEVTRHFPRPIRKLLDVGCARGAAGAALKREMAGLRVTGIENDPALCASARGALDRVIGGEASEALRALAAEGARFDALLFADVLEHLEDPIAALGQARALAEPNATLLASVPNAGHLSLVRDLLLGRFDPVPAGLADAGHLRWFTKPFLREALEEAGWRVDQVEGLPGAPPPDADDFLERLSGWPAADRESLMTYQWVAVARAADPSA